MPETVGRSTSRGMIHKAHKDLWNPPLWEVWEYLEHGPKLGEVAEVHRGIEWNLSLKESGPMLFSPIPKKGFQEGLDKVPGKIDPYLIRGTIYLNMEDRFRRTNAHFLPWRKDKVIVNRLRVSLSPWRIVASPDRHKLVLVRIREV